MDYAGNSGVDQDGKTGVVAKAEKPIVRIKHITDGTSNTMAVGEKQMNVSMFGQSFDDNEPYTRPGWNGDWEVYRWGATSSAPARDYRAPDDTTSPHRFGSSHTSGFNAVFADGSVRHVRFSVNPTTWQRACVLSGWGRR